MTSTTTLPLAFTDLGSGDTGLLFLPGWCGDRSLYDGVVDRLAPRHRVVSVNWPGHGESPAPSADFDTADLAEAAAALAADLGLRRVVPVAIAHAGWIALGLRRRLGPDVVPGVVLLDWMFLGPPPPFLEALEALQRESDWQAVRAGLFAMWTEGLDLPELDAYVADMGRQDFAMWSRAGREISAAFAAEGAPAEAFARLTPECPVLHAYAQPADPDLLAAQQEFAAQHSWFRVERFDASSHFPPLEVPDAVAALVGEYVEQIEDR